MSSILKVKSLFSGFNILAIIVLICGPALPAFARGTHSKTETITVSAGAGGTISPSGSVSVDRGSSETFTLTPNTGNIPILTVDGTAVTLSSTNTYTLTDVTESHTLVATFWNHSSFTTQTKTFTISFNATPTANDEDTVVGLSQNVAAAYASLAAIVRFNSNGDIDVRNGGNYTSAVTLAYKAGTTYNISMAVNIPAGTYSVNVTPAGASQVVLATNYAFRNSGVTSLSYINKYSDYVGNDVTLANVTLGGTTSTPVNGACGTANGVAITSAPTSNLCSTGTATATSGTGPWSWSCDGSNGGTNASCSAPIQTETLTVSAGSNGTISPTGSVKVNYGASQTFTLTPAVGYTASLMIDSVPTTLSSINTFTLSNITANHTIVASFTLQTETLTVSAGSNGTISPTGSVKVNYGASQTFTLTPSAGYTALLTVDGTPVTLSSSNTYTLSNITSNHTVAASFAAETVTLTVTGGSNGSISPSGTVTLNYGSSQTFTVTPSAGYNASLTVDGKAVTLTNNTYTLSDITTSHTIAASFTLTPVVVNGACGSANGVAVSSAPTSNLCSAGTATATSGTGPWSWSCDGANGGTTASCSAPVLTSTGGSCPKGSAYADGCSGAPAGTPQFPTMLSSYASRPAWNVAGADYAVGVPSGTVLKDPTTAALPTGCSFSGSTVTCSGSNVTLNGYDFSLHNGTTLNITGSNITVENSLFVVGSNQGTTTGRIINVASSAGNVTFLNNEVNGNNIGVVAGTGQTINVANNGTITFEYNYFHNSGGDMIDFGGGPQIQIIKYNLWKDIGYLTAHSDTIQWCGSKITSADLAFNVVDQTAAGLSGEGLLEPNSECTGASMSNLIEHNNTLISKVQDNFALGMVVTQDAGTATGDHVAVFDNYVDPTGIDNYTDSPWFPTGGTIKNGPDTVATLAHPTAMYGLINMLTGAAIPVPTQSNPTPVSPNYYVYPDSSGYSPSLNDIYTITASPATGSVTTGGVVTITLNMDEPWNVTGTPTLSLNDGGIATYVSGSGTNALVFTHTVSSSNTAVTNLAVTALNMPSGAVVKDNYGNLANLTNVATTFTGLAVSTSTTTPVNGACGTANGTAVSSAPSSDLCGTGTATATSGTGPWSWSCNGSNGGSNASCSAPVLTASPVNGACGTANGVESTTAPSTSLCGTGSASSVTETGTTLWNWSCAGSNGGTTATCSAPVGPAAINGTCGSANGTSVTSAPSSNLCSTGTATTVSGSGPWSWSCDGANGGTTATCSASVQSASSAAVNGNCGSAYGKVATSAPASNLCTSGSASSVSGSGPWTWECNPSNGGTVSYCVSPVEGTGVSGTWPGQAGNPVGYAAYGPLGTTPWPGGSFVSGTPSNPTVYKGYVFNSAAMNISGSNMVFISCDFNSGTSGVTVSGKNITFIGNRFQSNNVGDQDVQTTGSNLVFSYNSFTPLASMYTAPPGAAWPAAGAGQNTTTQTAGVNDIAANASYQYGLAINSGGPVYADHNDFWGFGNDGPQFMGTTALMVVTNNWVHDNCNQSGGAHQDGLGYVNGNAAPSNVIVMGNTVASLGNTQALAFQGATSGYNNVQVIDNYVSGYGYTISIAPMTNSYVSYNVFGTDIADVYGPLYGGDFSNGTGDAWKCNTINVVPGTAWTDEGDGNGAWTPNSSENGDYLVPGSGIYSKTDYQGNTTCPSAHGADSTPPTVPTNLSATPSTTSVSLTWTASSDNVGVAVYEIYRDGTMVGTSTTASYTDSGLTASTAYTYTVSALDALGNSSAQSAGVNVTTS